MSQGLAGFRSSTLSISTLTVSRCTARSSSGIGSRSSPNRAHLHPCSSRRREKTGPLAQAGPRCVTTPPWMIGQIPPTRGTASTAQISPLQPFLSDHARIVGQTAREACVQCRDLPETWHSHVTSSQAPLSHHQIA
ncbi:hypothetical protein L227DRAFT_430439 [Lentinus tigrinus ALCF2SS1-6]|uniref:Uncharacterized protein n=1 Tax=Lentinus tigrinus ALCF2SS1-6 TaxID=1328759 RepID=A0A5C2SFN0_9APHY|nr:hypothetical protein L227DRAFT_430439 [Lentinus tigrinus ALCF2SS1-6]